MGLIIELLKLLVWELGREGIGLMRSKMCEAGKRVRQRRKAKRAPAREA